MVIDVLSCHLDRRLAKSQLQSLPFQTNSRRPPLFLREREKKMAVLGGSACFVKVDGRLQYDNMEGRGLPPPSFGDTPVRCIGLMYL